MQYLVCRLARVTTLALAIALSLLPAASSFGAITREVIASGLSMPIFVTAPPGDTNRLFVVQRGGTIRIINLSNNTVNTTAFLNVNASPNTDVNSTDEGGLLSMAFHPNYATNGYFFVYYTTMLPSTGFTSRLSRFSVTADPNVADPNSETVFLEVDQPFTNHKGGTIAFRPGDTNHYLYLGLGDGGSSCDPFLNGQNLNAKLGKMLRIDVDAGPGGDLQNPFAPATNPFVGVAGDDLIWDYGLRNPFRFSFDRRTGDLYIGDVGQDTREEIDFEAAGSAGGLNFGWNDREGTIAAPCTPSSPTLPGMVAPIFDYGHSVGGAAIIGGDVYRGPLYATLYGRYFFADFVTKQMWSCVRSGASISDLQEHTSILNPNSQDVVAFGEDGKSALYIVELGGTISRITDPTSPLVDSDGDGVFDLYETGTGVYVSPTDTGTNPGATDSDNDGLSDGAEVNTYHTNPNLVDTDGDGFIDSLEIADGTNPNNAASNQPRANVYVQIGAPAPRMGTLANPTATLGAAVPVAQPGGTVHFVNAGNTNETFTLNKAMTVVANAGTVRVGAP